jgi:hypothetical protein
MWLISRNERGRSLAESTIIYTPTKWMSLAFSFMMVATFLFYIYELFFVVWRNFKRFKEDKTFAEGWRVPLKDIRMTAPV